jgi:hypothetical protein
MDMSLSLAVVSNVLSPIIGKVAVFMQAKGAELATAAGSLFIAAGMLLGSHAISNLHASAQKISQVTSDKRMIFSKEAHLQVVKQRLLRVEAQYHQRCAAETTSTCNTPIGYRRVQNTARALMMDLPHYAVRNGVTLASISTGNNQAKGFSALPIAGYPGVMQVAFDISGTYSTLAGLQQFFADLPPSTALTGVSIKGPSFTANVGAYGLSA